MMNEEGGERARKAVGGAEATGKMKAKRCALVEAREGAV